MAKYMAEEPEAVGWQDQLRIRQANAAKEAGIKLLDDKGQPKRVSKYVIDNTINHVKVDGALRPGTMSRPNEKQKEAKYLIIDNGVFPLAPHEAAHLHDLVRGSARLNAETALLRREARKEEAQEKVEFNTVFDMDSKDFVVREDREYKKSVVAPQRAKVARSVTKAELKQDYSEITASIVKPDHLAKYRSAQGSQVLESFGMSKGR